MTENTVRALEVRRPTRRYFVMLITIAITTLLSPATLAADRPGVVFHLDADGHANRALRQIGRQLEASPDVPIRVILIASAVNIALEGAKDDHGGLYSAQIEQLLANGVQFFACENTLLSFNIPADRLAFGIDTVPSGVAELTRLQLERQFAYIKL